jgi:single-stranded DNA-specific DHH superfamily exonuclease
MSATGRMRKPTSSVEMLLLRDRLGYRRYRKTAKRDPEKRQLILELALKRIEKAERDNYTLIGPRRRKVTFQPH